MKNLYSLILLITIFLRLPAQQNYCDFEGMQVITFGTAHTGFLDSTFENPAPDAVNSSGNCALYVRDTSFYDFIKMYPDTKMVDITPYVSNAFSAPKIKLKLYSTAPAGSFVLLQLGIKTVDNYPAGIHSEYIAATSAQNQWEILTFNYFQSPSGSLVTPDNIDKIVVLFSPGTNAQDTFYFDDPTGPLLLSSMGTAQLDMPTFKLLQNIPNPAKEITHINFQITSSGFVSLNLFDMLGNPVHTLVNENMKPGTYSIPVETGEIPNGIYFYSLKKDGFSRSMKMIVSK